MFVADDSDPCKLNFCRCDKEAAICLSDVKHEYNEKWKTDSKTYCNDTQMRKWHDPEVRMRKWHEPEVRMRKWHESEVRVRKWHEPEVRVRKWHKSDRRVTHYWDRGLLSDSLAIYWEQTNLTVSLTGKRVAIFKKRSKVDYTLLQHVDTFQDLQLLNNNCIMQLNLSSWFNYSTGWNYSVLFEKNLIANWLYCIKSKQS